MKLLKKFNPVMSACALATIALFVVDPTLITGVCCGCSTGMFISDTIYNWDKR